MEDHAAVARITAFVRLDAEEVAYLSKLEAPIQRFRRGQTVRREGSADPAIFLLHRGWAASSIRKPDGRYQMLRAHIPGDMLGVPSLALVKAHDTITALSPLEVSAIRPHELMQVFADRPRIAAAMFLIAQEERIISMDRLMSVGTSNATQRLAALIIELKTRLERSGAVDKRSFDAPLTQPDIGALIGVSAIHVNRSLAGLRRDEIATWAGGIVRILDEHRLRQLAGVAQHKFVRQPAWLPT